MMKKICKTTLLLLVTISISIASAKENALTQPTSLQKERARLIFSQNKLQYNLPQTGAVSANPFLKKNKGKALLRSLLVPGAGERYVGKKTIGKAFLISEITLWIGYFAFREYGRWIKDDARTYAADHSGASISGKPSQFFVDLGLYDDVDQYNDAQQRMRNFDKVYSDPGYFWYWDSPENRRRYERMRIASDRAINRSVLVLGGILANHLISAIDAVWQTHVYNKKLKKQAFNSLKINIQVNPDNGNLSLNLQKLF